MTADSAGMWANMLGLGPVLQAINDPSFHQQVAGFVASVTDVQQRVVRIEAKLDFIISRMGPYDPVPIAVTFVDLGPAGTGTHTVAGGAPDDGTGGAGATSGGAGVGAGAIRPDGINGAAS